MKRKRKQLVCFPLVPRTCAPMFAQVMAIGEAEEPTEAWGWKDTRGRWRRFRAHYPNGFQLSFHLTDQNRATRINAQIKLRGEVRP